MESHSSLEISGRLENSNTLRKSGRMWPIKPCGKELGLVTRRYRPMIMLNPNDTRRRGTDFHKVKFKWCKVSMLAMLQQLW